MLSCIHNSDLGKTSQWRQVVEPNRRIQSKWASSNQIGIELNSLEVTSIFFRGEIILESDPIDLFVAAFPTIIHLNFFKDLPLKRKTINT